jgi:hypothetical protein
LLKRDRIKDFFRFPVSGLFDGSMKLWSHVSAYKAAQGQGKPSFNPFARKT